MNTTITRTRAAAEKAAEKLQAIADSEARKSLAPVLDSLSADTTNTDLHDRVLTIAVEQLASGEPLGDDETLLMRVLKSLQSRAEILEVRRAAIPADKRERSRSGNASRKRHTEYDCLTRWIHWIHVVDQTKASLRAQREVADPTAHRSNEEHDWATANLPFPSRHVLVLVDEDAQTQFKCAEQRSHLDYEIQNAITPTDEQDRFLRPVRVVDLQEGTSTPLTLTVNAGEPAPL